MTQIHDFKDNGKKIRAVTYNGCLESIARESKKGFTPLHDRLGLAIWANYVNHLPEVDRPNPYKRSNKCFV